jgi:hypothetical protein
MISFSPKIVTQGLVFHFDADNEKSFPGAPTTNIIPDIDLSNYNNVPSHVTTDLVDTGLKYRGARLWKQTLTPTTSTGVSYLTNANNPGIGIYHSMSTTLVGGTYVGFSLFFKPMTAMYSSPIFTAYSNIAGWQSTDHYDTMNDGWFRANVIWNNGSTLGDSKYWAINPLTATISVPQVIYWAAPFRENQGYTNFVSPYSANSRGVSTSCINLASGGSIDLTNATYDSAGKIIFNGATSYLSAASIVSGLQMGTLECWVKFNSFGSDQDTPIGIGNAGGGKWRIDVYNNGSVAADFWTDGNATSATGLVTTGKWFHLVSTYDGANKCIYINGTLRASAIASRATAVNAATVQISGYTPGGYIVDGFIPIARVYNRALSALEVLQNFNTTRSKFGM